jgi:hypothetical protein
MKRPKCSAGNVQCGTICLPKGKKCREGEQHGQKVAAQNQSYVYKNVLGGDRTVKEVADANKQHGMTKKIAKEYVMEVAADYIESQVHGERSRMGEINKKYGSFFGERRRKDSASLESVEYACGYLSAKGVDFTPENCLGVMEAYRQFRSDARSQINGQCGQGWEKGPGGKCVRARGSYMSTLKPKQGGVKGAAKHGAKVAAFGFSGASEYDRQRSAGQGRGKAALAAAGKTLKGAAQAVAMNPVGGHVYRRSRDVGESRLKAGAKGVATGTGVAAAMGAGLMAVNARRNRKASNS